MSVLVSAYDEEQKRLEGRRSAFIAAVHGHAVTTMRYSANVTEHCAAVVRAYDIHFPPIQNNGPIGENEPIKRI